MTDRTYRVTEIVGTSKEGLNQAITNGISRAGETLRHLDWFEVTEIRGHVVDNQIDHYQVGHEGRLPPRGLLIPSRHSGRPLSADWHRSPG